MESRIGREIDSANDEPRISQVIRAHFGVTGNLIGDQDFLDRSLVDRRGCRRACSMVYPRLLF